MIFIDGTGAPLGRVASYAAKQSLKGEEVRIFNCDKIIITGSKRFIKNEFQQKRGRVGTTQRGPKHAATSEKIVKMAIRGMIPNYRAGRGKIAFSKILCYNSTPKEYLDIKPLSLFTEKKIKYSEVKEFTKK